MTAPPVAVVLRALGLGDLLTAVPALRGLARALPGHRRLLLAPRSLAELTALLVADGRRVVEAVVHTPGLGAAPPLAERVDVAVNLHGRGPESHRQLLAAAPRTLVAFAHADVPASRDGPAWDDGEHERARWPRLLRAHGVAADPADLALEHPGPDPVAAAWAGATVLHPGAASVARRWPADRWARVAEAELRAGRRVAVTGGPGEAALGRAVARAAGLPPGSCLAGATSLRTLAAVVASAGRVVCGDTGVGHLATAMGTPSVLLFGPTSPEVWGPPRCARHRVLWAGRLGDPHGTTVDPGLLEIAVPDVVEALGALPERSGSGSA